MTTGSCHLCCCRLKPLPILQLRGMPKAAQYYPERDEFQADTGVDLDVFQCPDCGLVQLNRNPVEYYREVITAASVSPRTRSARLGQMQEFMGRFGLKGKRILEVGCGEGHMLDLIGETGGLPTGIEASANSVAAGRRIGRRIISGFLGDMDIVEGGPYDAFASYNYIEHLPEPGSIIRRIFANTTVDAAGFVTVPNLDYLLKSQCFYEFVADHLSYFTVETLSFAFAQNGFEVLECTTINEDNDILAVVRKRRLLDLTRDCVEMRNLIGQLHRIVLEYSAAHKKIAVWGAGHRTLALLALSGLDSISYVVDSASFKQGKFTPVTHLRIVPPEHLLTNRVDLVVVMVPGLYPAEVLKTLEKMALPSKIAVLRGNMVEFLPGQSEA